MLYYLHYCVAVLLQVYYIYSLDNPDIQGVRVESALNATNDVRKRKKDD